MALRSCGPAYLRPYAVMALRTYGPMQSWPYVTSWPYVMALRYTAIDTDGGGSLDTMELVDFIKALSMPCAYTRRSMSICRYD